MVRVDRLYNFFIPNHYKLHIKINKRQLMFSAEAIICGKCCDENIRLHSKDLIIETTKVNGTEEKFKIVPEKDEIIINNSRILDKDVEIYIKYHGKITKSMHGMYPCYGRNKEIIIATQFESHHAREVFPCIDEPEAKATFNLSLETPKQDIVIANTSIETSTVNKNIKTTVFDTTPKMSPYLLAFVCGPLYHKKAKTKNGTLIRAWSTKDQLHNVDFALDIAVNNFNFFNDYFRVPYSLNKCDLVALPDFAAGAMENWGLITFRETCMLVDKLSTNIESKKYTAMVIAHEIAHQWFGNLVTMRWWDDLWLNEGFASWLEFLAIDNLYPEWNMWTHFLATEQLAAMRLDSLNNTHPIQTVIKHPDDIRTNFDSISYAKGACVIYMLHSYLGKDCFRDGLENYLKLFAYSNTETDDLWKVLENTSHKSVKQFMSVWTKNSGFPLLTINQESRGYSLQQQRFIIEESKSRNSKTIWPIPINSKYANTPIFSDRQLIINTKKNSEIFINTGHSGFYVTKYWPKFYQEINKLWSLDKIGENERLGFISDLHTLNKANLISIINLFDHIKLIRDEDSAPVWDIISLVIGDVRRVMDEQVRNSLKNFINYLTTNQLNRLGWNTSKKDNHYDELLRPLILGLASSADNEKVVEKMRHIFDKANQVTDIPLHYRHVLLISVAKRGDGQDFNKLIDFLRASKSPDDRIIILNSLLRFTNSTEIKHGLELIRSSEVKLQDVGYCLIFSLSNYYAKESTWHWLKENWHWLKENLGKDTTYSRLPVNIANVFSNRNFKEEYISFFKDVEEPSLELSTKQGLELLEANIRWREYNQPQLFKWLSNY